MMIVVNFHIFLVVFELDSSNISQFGLAYTAVQWAAK